MENWRFFIERDKLLENKDYIQYVLGIEIPLNESKSFSKEFSQTILKEQLLLEGFFDDAVSKVKLGAANLGMKTKQAVNKATAWVNALGKEVGELFHSLWIIFTNPDKVKEYIEILNDRISIRKIPTLVSLKDNLTQLLAGTKFESVAKNFEDIVENILNTYNNMAVSWKKALVGSSISVVLDFVFSKFKSFINQVINIGQTIKDEIKDEIKNQIGELLKSEIVEYFKENFESVYEKAAMYMTGIGAWIDWIKGIVGSVKFVAASLSGTTKRFV
jgi:hypothetical protein